MVDLQQMVMDLQAQIQALQQQQAQAPGGQWMQAFMERMVALQEQQATAMQDQRKALEEQSARTLPKENPNYVAQSIFLKPSGEPWAADLKCDIYLNSIRLNRTPLTKAEVDALNTLVGIDKARIRKVDGSDVLGSVTPREDALGRIDRLTMTLPMKKDDNPQHYPALDVIAQQFAAQAAALVSV
jgi:hypothetical protein